MATLRALGAPAAALSALSSCSATVPPGSRAAPARAPPLRQLRPWRGDVYSPRPRWRSRWCRRRRRAARRCGAMGRWGGGPSQRGCREARRHTMHRKRRKVDPCPCPIARNDRAPWVRPPPLPGRAPPPHRWHQPPCRSYDCAACQCGRGPRGLAAPCASSVGAIASLLGWAARATAVGGRAAAAVPPPPRPTRASARCRALRLLEGRAEAVGYSGCAAGKGPSACAGAVPGGGTSVAAGFCVALLHFSCSGALGAVRGAWRLA
eukprot:scaffold71637_cov59-Phaeocystis_antarctica.AAC.2